MEDMGKYQGYSFLICIQGTFKCQEMPMQGKPYAES